MNGPARRGEDNGAIGTSRTLVAALAALAAVLVVAIGVVVALIRNDDGSTESVAGDVTTSPQTSTSSPRVSRLVPQSSAAPVTGVLEVSGPACDSEVINSDLLFQNSGARIVDCGSGWAVMASAVSGDPYWVAYSAGRWRRVEEVSIYRGTCADDAIARGAPAWMAQKHLGACPPRGGRGPAAPPAPSTPPGLMTPPDPNALRATASPTRPPIPTSSRTETSFDESTSSATSTTRTSATTPTSTTPTEVPTTAVPEGDPEQ